MRGDLPFFAGLGSLDDERHIRKGLDTHLLRKAYLYPRAVGTGYLNVWVNLRRLHRYHELDVLVKSRDVNRRQHQRLHLFDRGASAADRDAVGNHLYRLHLQPLLGLSNDRDLDGYPFTDYLVLKGDDGVSLRR